MNNPNNTQAHPVSVNRREFLRSSAAAAALFTAPNIIRAQGANKRIGIGFIGGGNRSKAHMRMLSSLKEAGEAIELVAVCDTYKPRRESRQEEFNIIRTYATCEELLQDPNVDAVVIATPDHHHAPQAIKAVSMSIVKSRFPTGGSLTRQRSWLRWSQHLTLFSSWAHRQ